MTMPQAAGKKLKIFGKKSHPSVKICENIFLLFFNSNSLNPAPAFLYPPLLSVKTQNLNTGVVKLMKKCVHFSFHFYCVQHNIHCAMCIVFSFQFSTKVFGRKFTLQMAIQNSSWRMFWPFWGFQLFVFTRKK